MLGEQNNFKMKYKAKLVTNYWTEEPEKKIKEFKKAGFRAKEYCSCESRTNIELIVNLNSNTLEEFLEKFEKALRLLDKFEIKIWSVVNTKEVILTEEVDLEKINFITLPIERAVIDYGIPFEQAERFKKLGRQVLEEALL